MAASETAPIEMNSETRLNMAVNVIVAFVGNNKVLQGDLAPLIGSVYTAFMQIEKNDEAPNALPLNPKVPIKKSVTHEHIICLEDGLQFRSLKRHLRSKFGLSPDEYRKRWGLPLDYPMVAPAYSEARSKLAKASGLGQLRSKAVAKALAAQPSKRKPRTAKAAV